MIAEHRVMSRITGREHRVEIIQCKRHLSYNSVWHDKEPSRASTTARTMTHGAESRGRTAACEKTGKNQRGPLFCGDSWDFFQATRVRGPFAATVPDSRIDRAKSANAVDSRPLGIPGTYVSLDSRRKKREKFRIRACPIGIELCRARLGVRKSIGLGCT